MKKFKPWMGTVLAVVLLAVGYFWYTRPMTLEQLCPELPLDQITGVNGWYRVSGSEAGNQNFTLEEEQADALLALVKGQTFRRSLANLLPQGDIRTASGDDDDFSWTVNFEWRDAPIRDAAGNGHTGDLLQLHDFFGELTVRDQFSQKDYEIRSPDFPQWRQEVFSIITEGEN